MQAFEVRREYQFDPVVIRWVHPSGRPVEHVLADVTVFPVAEKIALDAGGELRLDEPFGRSTDATGRVTWRANARVVTSGASVVRYARVEVAVVRWSDGLIEVAVRGRGRHLVSWGERRERRYFDRAHDAASHVARALTASDEDPSGSWSQVA